MSGRVTLHSSLVNPKDLSAKEKDFYPLYTDYSDVEEFQKSKLILEGLSTIMILYVLPSGSFGLKGRVFSHLES